MSESNALATRENGSAHVALPREEFIDFTGMDFSSRWKFIEQLAKSDLVPKDFRGKPTDVMLVIDMGNQLGFRPLQALQSIACINGRPSLYGDSLIALVRNSPKCEWIEEVEIGEAGTDSYGWRVTAKRVGDPKLVQNSFTVRQAKVAKLWGKAGPWTDYPDRMLKMRARGFSIRDGFADVLKGLALAEEVVDVPPDVRDAIVNAPSRAEAVKAALRARTAVATAVMEDEPPAPEAVAQAAADVAATIPVEPSTAERITQALDAEAAQDPDFQRMDGPALRDYVNEIAIGRNITPAQLQAIEQSMPTGKMLRGNVRDVLRAVRELAMKSAPDAPTDEIPDAPEAVDGEYQAS